ncbi:hypothetical protein MKW94_027987 [Papaver nudicaule]|uniref:Cationic amino acid transporter C-terminal domain-containing protein n=1 Tax=Papaver nudicaule TaxID=74823 RepID=A0AA41VFG5_PAPNU|nr:hypothetical protein [Papaver nudicaule]
MTTTTSGTVKNRGCGCTKEDFLPEESFQSWENYVEAVTQTGSRLVNRVTTRSQNEIELNEVKAQTIVNELKKPLNWWDLMLSGIGAALGASVFVYTGIEARLTAGPAVVLSYLISGVSAMLSVFCYIEFAVEMPIAGGSFDYLRAQLGDLVAFIAAGNIILEYVIGGAAVARSWTSHFAVLLNRKPDDLRILVHSLPNDYCHLDFVAVCITMFICVLAVRNTKGSPRLNYITSIFHVLVIVFIIVAGLTRANVKNFSSFAPFGVSGVFKASSVLFFSTLSEGTKKPRRDIPIGLVGSMVVTIAAYCLLAVTLCLMQPFDEIDIDAPYAVAFSAAGVDWAKYVVAAGALKGMTTVLFSGAVDQAWELTHIARTHMIPPWFAKINEKTGTPVNATFVLLVATSVVAFFTDLQILSSLVSIATLFIVLLVAVAFLVSRYYVTEVTTSANRDKLVLCLILIFSSSIANAFYWALDGRHWIVYSILVPIWFSGTIGLRLFVPQAREPKLWGVPLVPWLPSTSIAINIFLLGSIDRMSYLRFGAWTSFLVIYYVFFGLHASYDTAQEAEQKRENDQVGGV